MSLRGLSHISTERLQELLRALRAGRLSAPLTPQALMLAGFSDLFDRVDVLLGLDATAVHAVIVVAIAERRAAEDRLRKLAARPPA